MRDYRQGPNLSLRTKASSDRLEVSLEEDDVGEPQPDEIVVRVEASPVNPSDLGLIFGAADPRQAIVEERGGRRRLVMPLDERQANALAGRRGLSLCPGLEGAGTVVDATGKHEALIGRTVAMFGGGMYTRFRRIPLDECLVYPEGTRLFGFMQELHRTFSPRERTDYLPEWPGFSAVFNTRVTAAPAKCRVELEPALDYGLASSPAPHTMLADRLIQAVRSLEAFRTEFDVLFVYLPDRWEAAFFGQDDDFDLHDCLKAFAAIRGMPLQIVREGRALSYSCRASVMWRIGLAIYAKAGGVPWKLADTKAETAFIGISYAVRADDSCSQVFDEDGAGLEFIAFDTNEIQVQRENPFLSRAEMFRVITRSMELYRRRHGGRSPRRVMIHKTTEFKEDEIAGCFEALGARLSFSRQCYSSQIGMIDTARSVPRTMFSTRHCASERNRRESRRPATHHRTNDRAEAQLRRAAYANVRRRAVSGLQ